MTAGGFSAAFGSKELTGLVKQALAQNLDIGAAVARIEEADAVARIGSSAMWPVLSLGENIGRIKYPYGALRTNYSVLGLNAGYEVDFWGKNRDASLAVQSLAVASRFDRDVVEIATITSTINAYFQLLAAQDRLRIAQQNVKVAERVLSAVKARVDVGTAAPYDYSQQETVLSVQRSAIPPLQETLRQTKNTLAVLVGQTPESIDVKGGSLERLRFPDVKPGLPSQLLLRRPDVAEAEEKLASAEFTVMQARAAFFPSIQITGMYGLQSFALKALLRPEAITWSIAEGLAQPLLDGYRLQGQYMLSQAKFKELAQLYCKQILTALADTENALIAVSETRSLLKLQTKAVASALRTFDAAEAQWEIGTIDIVSLATAQTTLFQNQDRLVQARLAHFQAATSLYQALGGGWEDFKRAQEIDEANAAFQAEKGPWP